MRIATFNVYGLLLVAGRHGERMNLIGEDLARRRPDVVCFQEAFLCQDREVLANHLRKAGLQYDQYFASGVVGSGLYVVSRFPIVESFFQEYVHNGPWWCLLEGDKLAGKGVALCRILTNRGQLVDVYNTHLIAAYDAEGGSAYREIRLEQSRELAAFVRRASIPGVPALLMGDFNCDPGEAAFDDLVVDLELQRLQDRPSTLDHVFAVRRVSGGGSAPWTFDSLYTRPLGERLPGRPPWSDHLGYLVRVAIRP